MENQINGFKFEVGQIVRHKLGEEGKVLILEKCAQFCYGGLRQNWYLCVVGVPEGSFHAISFEPEKRFKFFEIELEEIPSDKSKQNIHGPILRW